MAAQAKSKDAGRGIAKWFGLVRLLPRVLIHTHTHTVMRALLLRCTACATLLCDLQLRLWNADRGQYQNREIERELLVVYPCVCMFGTFLSLSMMSRCQDMSYTMHPTHVLRCMLHVAGQLP